MTSPILEAALAHHAEGRAVIAVGQNKKPYHKWKHLFTRPQTEAEVSQEFANGAHGLAMVLYPACNYAVVDRDGLHAPECWRLKTGIELPETARNITRSGSDHLYFTMPPGDFSHFSARCD